MAFGDLDWSGSRSFFFWRPPGFGCLVTESPRFSFHRLAPDETTTTSGLVLVSSLPKAVWVGAWNSCPFFFFVLIFDFGVSEFIFVSDFVLKLGSADDWGPWGLSLLVLGAKYCTDSQTPVTIDPAWPLSY